MLGRDPECWTALAARARCLVKLAEDAGPAERRELLIEALASAQRAVELWECAETWRAVSEAASALGNGRLARQATALAERWERKGR